MSRFSRQNFPHRLRAQLRFIRRNILLITGVSALFLFVIIFLSHIPDGSAAAEHLTYLEGAGLKQIADNPINAPYKLAVFVASRLSKSVLAVRAISLVFFFITSLSMYYTLKHWHTKKAALLATAAFSTNAVVLTVGRLGTPLVAVFGWFIFTAMLLWQVHGKSNRIIPGIVMLGIAFLLYTPGAPWFFVIFAFFYWDRFRSAFKNVRTGSVVFSGIIALIIMSPLIVAFVRNTSLISNWLLLPESFTIKDIARSVLEVPSAFVYRMPQDPLINVGTLPVFDLAGGFLFLMGLYAYHKKLQLDRTRLIIAMGLVSVIVGAFGESTTGVVVALPFAYCIAAAGVEFLLDEWNRIFPKNPFAKSFGLMAVTTVVLFGCYYQLTRFLVVWPQTPDTRTTYSLPRILE